MYASLSSSKLNHYKLYLHQMCNMLQRSLQMLGFTYLHIHFSMLKTSLWFFLLPVLVSYSSVLSSVFLTTRLCSSPQITSSSWCSGIPRRLTRSRQSRGYILSYPHLYILRQILTFLTIFCDILNSDSCTIFTRPKLLAEILKYKYGRNHLVFWLWQSWSLLNVLRLKLLGLQSQKHGLLVWSLECTIQK